MPEQGVAPQRQAESGADEHQSGEGRDVGVQIHDAVLPEVSAPSAAARGAQPWCVPPHHGPSQVWLPAVIGS